MTRPKLSAGIVACAVLLGTSAAARAGDLPAPRTTELGPEAPAGSRSREDRPAVTAYLPSPAAATGAGIMVFPGGGFTRRCEDHEGVLVAEWLRAHGIAAFLVRYRVVPFATLKESLDDGHLAVQHVRAHAAEYGVSPRRLGAIGFSAGAVLAANVALRPRAGSRPDFLVLAYGDANQANPGVRGLAAHGLTPRQEELLDAYGYPYVFDEFRFHMTLTDRLSPADYGEVLQAAQTWFGPVLDQEVTLDRLSLFHERENKQPFTRIADFALGGAER